MKISDYKHADCKLFRTPSLDVTVVDKKLEETIVEAWKSGAQAQQTVNSLMQNQEVLGQLSDQISQSVEFQKKHALNNSEIEHQERIRAHEETYNGKINEIESVVETKAGEQKTKITQLGQVIQEKQQGYTAAQAQLEEMRARIKRKLGDLGGKQALEKLINIKETLQKPQTIEKQQTSQTKYEPQTTKDQQPQVNPETKTVNYEQPDQNYQQQNNYEQKTTVEPQTTDKVQSVNPAKTKKLKDLESALKTVEAEGPIDPLNKKTQEYEAIKEAKKEEKKSIIRRFFSKTWEILNYKIW